MITNFLHVTVSVMPLLTCQASQSLEPKGSSSISVAVGKLILRHTLITVFNTLLIWKVLDLHVVFDNCIYWMIKKDRKWANYQSWTNLLFICFFCASFLCKMFSHTYWWQDEKGILGQWSIEADIADIADIQPDVFNVTFYGLKSRDVKALHVFIWTRWLSPKGIAYH